MLSFSNITVRLGGTVILDGATAALPPGARVGMIGRNGAGKSTLMKVVAGLLEPDDGTVGMPKGARMGYIAQEAPAGTETPLDTVLAADTERAALLLEAETAEEPNRIGEIHERLNMIEAHSAPARAAKILIGLGFDEKAQQQPMDSFSGGWRMRVALAALLFSQPELLLLDEPSNHLDLEATLWLENFLTSYQATILVISHERDLLNNVVDHILHLQGGKTTLYPGGYDALRNNVQSVRRKWLLPVKNNWLSEKNCKPMSIAGVPKPIVQNRPKAASKHSPAWSQLRLQLKTHHSAFIFPARQSSNRR